MWTHPAPEPRAFRPASRRGFGLVEPMITMAVLAVGILGIAQLQVHASRQNGIARRTTIAATLARDFVETAQRWDFDDPRLASPNCGQGMEAPGYPITEELMGHEAIPGIALDFTASPASLATASAEATTSDALQLRPYDGAAPAILASAEPLHYQLLWSSRLLNPTDPDSANNCRTRLVTVVVRFPVAADRYKNVITTFATYDRSLTTIGGIPEQI